MTIEDLYSVYKKNPVVCTDSRTIVKDCIFFALKGENFNGNRFAEAAIQQGASYTIVDEDQFAVNERCIRVENVLETLQQLANFHRRQLKIPFIAVTGSNGKTTTKELLRNVLSKKYTVHATRGNLNNHIGVPLTILSIKENVEIAVIEMGANHIGEIKMLCRIAEPDYGIITNVGKAHLEGFGGFEGVKKGKGELYDFLSAKGGTVFLNLDNQHLADLNDKRKIRKRVTYGKENSPDCKGELLSASPFLKIKWNYAGKNSQVNTQMIGDYNFENVLAAICIGNYFNVEEHLINKAIEEYIPDNSRSQIIYKGTNTIVLDAYNANPTSVTVALKNFSSMNGQNKIVILGEMAELGNESEQEHKTIQHLISTLQFQKVFLVGKYFLKQTEDKNHFTILDSTDKLVSLLKNMNIQNSTVFIKGSRSMKMEKVLEIL
jgi:UDP-N-acetylmuramoyl-tripeptide--D-alanyl-D-alanine ligase